MATPLVREPNETRRQIMHKALERFALWGYNGTSMRDISAAAGVTKPVLYYYFKNKEHLYVSLIQDIFHSFLEALEETIEQDSDFFERIRRVIHIYFEYSMRNDPVMRLIFNTLFGPPKECPSQFIWELEEKHFQLLVRLFQEGLDRGLLPSRPVDPLVFHFLGSINIYLLAHMIRGVVFTPEAEDTIYELLMKGMLSR